MATQQSFLVQDSSTLSNFKSWGSAISAFFITAGWTQTTDTGQVNWSTIASVPTSGSFVYEIWQPGDALQTGTTKYFLKINYGNTSNNGVRLQFQLGTSTSGAGVLSGNTTLLLEPTSTNGATGGSSATYECDFSGDTGRMGMLMWRNAPKPGGNIPGVPLCLLVERTLSTTGSPQSDGVNIICFNGSGGAGTNVVQQTLTLGGAGAANASALGDYISLVNGQNLTGAFNGNTPFSPIFPDYGFYGNPITVGGFVHKQDVVEGTTFTTTIYGSTRTYLATALLSFNQPINSSFCMRYD